MLKTDFVGVRVASLLAAVSLSLVVACSDNKEHKKSPGKGKTGEPVAAADGTGKSSDKKGDPSDRPGKVSSAAPGPDMDRIAKTLPVAVSPATTFEASCVPADKSSAQKACVYSADLSTYGLDPSALDPYLTQANLALLYAGKTVVPPAGAGGAAQIAALLAAAGGAAKQPAASGTAPEATVSSAGPPSSLTAQASAGTGKIGAFSVHWGKGESVCAAQSATFGQAALTMPKLTVEAFRRGLRCVDSAP